MYGPGGKEHVDGPVFNIDDYTQYKAMQLSKNAYKWINTIYRDTILPILV